VGGLWGGEKGKKGGKPCGGGFACNRFTGAKDSGRNFCSGTKVQIPRGSKIIVWALGALCVVEKLQDEGVREVSARVRGRVSRSKSA
jgi:hypothetical protein